jgi:hypothetical protein
MITRACLCALAVIVVYWTIAYAQRGQHPVVDAVANKVIHKYEQSSCEQLREQKSEPKSPQEQEAVELLHKNPQIRTEFLNKVAAPIANKMFECGLIP